MNTKNTKGPKSGAKAPPAKTPAKTPAAPVKKSSNRSRWIAGGIAALVVVALLIAIVASGGGDDSVGDSGGAAPSTDASGSTVTTPTIEEVRPVTITGDPLVPYVSGQSDGAIGVAAPRIDGESFDGSPVSIAPGKPTLVVFLAHWCPHCRQEVPLLVDWYTSGAVPAGVDVIAVATNTSKDYPNYPPSEWLESEDWPWPVMADDEGSTAMASFGLSGFPGFTLLNADGTVAVRRTGEVPMATLTQDINTALGL